MKSRKPRGRLLASTLLIGGIGILLPLFGVEAQPPDSAGLDGDAASGRRLFTAYRCYACHGYSGETGSGTRLNPPRLDQAAFIAYLRNPPRSYRGNSAGVMPPYAGDDVSDQNLADIFAYLESLPSSSPPLEKIDLIETAGD